MSKANGTATKKDTFLQHVSLKNYKSIKDVEIDFKPGLNIIIGKNASGKTNFVNGLNTILNFETTSVTETESIVRALFESDSLEIKREKYGRFNGHVLKHNHSQGGQELSLKLNGELVNADSKDGDFFEDFLYYLDPVLIRYGLFYRDCSTFVNLPTSFVLMNNGGLSFGFSEVLTNDNRTRFSADYFNIFWHTVIMDYWFENTESLLSINWDLSIRNFSEKYLKDLNDAISFYSPIKSIRLNPDFNIIKQDQGEKQTVTNFYLEFLIDDNWLPYNLLSDGTKRLFYIISEIFSSRIHNDPIAKVDLNVILLEEPELGIHPHQLHSLMQFIKEQSKQKQIILTTHSPQVLDILEPNELDRIIICHSDPKNGTQLSHLTEKEIAKAKKYMQEEAFLSDYWRFSDLEPA